MMDDLVDIQVSKLSLCSTFWGYATQETKLWGAYHTSFSLSLITPGFLLYSLLTAETTKSPLVDFR